MLWTRLQGGNVGSAYVSVSPPAAFPTTWNVVRNASNPVIVVAGGEPLEQYVPAPFRIGSDTYVLIKGAARIYLYKATGGALPYVGQNGGSAVIDIGTAGAWDDTHALEPCALYDSAATTIRAWYKGSGDGGTTWNWGYATAPGATPTVFTKDAANPILTAAAINTKMGGAGVTDTAPFDVIYDGSTYHFYGYVAYNSIYQLVHMTGSTWNAPDVSTLTTILTPGISTTLAGTGSVFSVPGPTSPPYGMFYTWGPVTGSGRSIRVGTSTDLVTWNFSSTTDVMAPTSGWESYHVYTPRLLRETTVPYLAPITSGSSWTLFYSGADASWVHSQTGLATLTPT